jgi:hypothetical protein
VLKCSGTAAALAAAEQLARCMVCLLFPVAGHMKSVHPPAAVYSWLYPAAAAAAAAAAVVKMAGCCSAAGGVS